MAKAHMCYGCMTMQEAAVCPVCGYDMYQGASPVYLKPGTVLANKYLIGKVIGHGGFGITYLAYDTVLGIKLAVKEYFVQENSSRLESGEVVPFEGEKGERFKEGTRRFLEEARILAKFEGNPGIVSVRDFFKANGTAYLVMTYLEGMNLRQYLAKNGPMPYEKVRQEIIPVLAGALSAVHGAGLLHRDISPDNIFLTKQGQVKIIDFGAARQVAGPSVGSMSIILKPGYAPEEQYRSHGKQGPWTDVYAVAATIYRTITGKVPPESLDRLETDTIEPPSKYCDIPSQQEKVLLKAMSVKADDRYQSMREFHNALLSAQYDENLTTIAYKASPEPRTRENMRVDEETNRIPVVKVRPQPKKGGEAPKRKTSVGNNKEGGSGWIKLAIVIVILALVLLAGYFVIDFIKDSISDIIPSSSPGNTGSFQVPGETQTKVPEFSPTAAPVTTAQPETKTQEPADTPLEETPEPTQTPEPVPFPDVSGIDVDTVNAFGDTIADVLSYAPRTDREITYYSGETVGNYIYQAAKPSSGNIIVSRFIVDSNSLGYGTIEHYFERDGSLYMINEKTGDLQLVLPKDACVGMQWKDAAGSKEIVEISAVVSDLKRELSDCLVVKVTSNDVRYIVYRKNVGVAAVLDDYIAPGRAMLRIRYDEVPETNGTSIIDALSEMVGQIN